MADDRALTMAFWVWLAVTPTVGLFAAALGADARAVAISAAFALAPAAAGLALLPVLPRDWAQAGLLGAWLVGATGLAATTGGAFSPLAVSFIIPAALARLVAPHWFFRTGAAAVFCYALAAWIWASGEGNAFLSPFPEFMTVVSLAFAVAIFGFHPMPPQPAVKDDAMAQRIAEVSHDLRTPLTHILGFSEMIERELFGPIGERYVEYAGLIRKSGGHLLEMVNDLLDISKIEAGRYDLEREAFDARAIVEEVVRLSKDTAERKNITLAADLPSHELSVNADPRALRRMLINTSGNAIKFTPEGGRVTLVARASGRRLMLDTVDTGPGIPEAERERLGKPYERGASGARAEGTGLGLSLVRALAELHGGSLSFHDAPGGGALVRIEMPVVKI